MIDATLDEIVDGDWTEVVRTPAYEQFAKAGGDAVKTLEASSSLRDAAKLMRMFQASKSTSTKPISTRQQQLTAAITPRGAGGHSQAPAGNPFAEGFKTGRA
jgi:hypothetical protein